MLGRDQRTRVKGVKGLIVKGFFLDASQGSRSELWCGGGHDLPGSHNRFTAQHRYYISFCAAGRKGRMCKRVIRFKDEMFCTYMQSKDNTVID